MALFQKIANNRVPSANMALFDKFELLEQVPKVPEVPSSCLRFYFSIRFSRIIAGAKSARFLKSSHLERAKCQPRSHSWPQYFLENRPKNPTNLLEKNINCVVIK